MTARGVCAVCGSLRARRRDGMIRGHEEPGTSHRCQGSGQPPATRQSQTDVDEASDDDPQSAA